MNRDDVIRIIGDKISTDMCVAFIGAGVSAGVNYEGRDIPGYPLARDILRDLQNMRDYLRDIQDFGEATFLFRAKEGRAELERYFRGKLSREGMSPLPAHQFLAKLRLPYYISMNFDELLENALEETGANILPIIQDTDVPQISKDSIPVMKLHGSVSRPDSMRIARDETFDFDERIPIVADLLSTVLASKLVLFLGFSFSDPDVYRIFRYLRVRLGDHMPRSIAITRHSYEFLEEFWRGYNVDVVQDDATSFLEDLNRHMVRLPLRLQEDLEPWMASPFFWKLIEIRSLPTETQVIEALLSEVKRRIADGVDAQVLGNDIREAIELVLNYRSNYQALGALETRLGTIFQEAIAAPDNLWQQFSDLLHEREETKRRLQRKAANVIGDATDILLFSQSQRVADILTAVAPAAQSNITIHIAECRPKSPDAFQDAVGFANSLKDTVYQFQFWPDVAALHLLAAGRIQVVLMGAHAIFRDRSQRTILGFVNTCGSNAFATTALAAGVPLKVVFERDKVQDEELDGLTQRVSFEEEERIGREVVEALSTHVGLSERIQLRNIGYDLIIWRDGFEAVCDSENEFSPSTA